MTGPGAEFAPPLQPPSPQAPEVLGSLCLLLPALRRKYFLGKMAAVSVYERPVGGFSFDNCRRCGHARGQVPGGSGSAVPGSELGRGLIWEVQTKGERRGLRPVLRGPCDSGEWGPESGFPWRPSARPSSCPAHSASLRLRLLRRDVAPPTLCTPKNATVVLMLGGFSGWMGLKANSSFSFPEFPVRHSWCQCGAMWSCPSTLYSLLFFQKCRLGSRFCEERVQASSGPENRHDHRGGGL